jgi:hypothetical protein
LSCCLLIVYNYKPFIYFLITIKNYIIFLDILHFFFYTKYIIPWYEHMIILCSQQMGRGRVSVEFIPKEKSRKIVLQKRKIGLMKKVEELSILCDVDAWVC